MRGLISTSTYKTKPDFLTKTKWTSVMDYTDQVAFVLYLPYLKLIWTLPGYNYTEGCGLCSFGYRVDKREERSSDVASEWVWRGGARQECTLLERRSTLL